MSPERDKTMHGKVVRPIVRACALAAVLAGAVVLSGARQAPAPAAAPSTFAARVAALSEPEGYFDTDNLISNESSYLQVSPELRRRRGTATAYIGVGPDQNFSYIAEMRPSIAFIIDVRRDNLLLHLLFKGLFEGSRTRIEYLSQLFGRPAPENPESWKDAGIDRLIAHVDKTAAKDVDTLRMRVNGIIRRFGVPLSTADLQTIDRFHRRFIEAGMSLQFQTTGRPPQSYYPTYRQLLAETDPAGKQASFLASEEAFLVVKKLQAQDLVIPVVGDLSGPSALAAIGRMLTARRESVAAFYVSNVEFYLFGQGTFGQFVHNLGRVPHSANGVLIRSIFGRFTYGRGGGSVSRTQSIDELLSAFAAGRIRYYGDLAGVGG